MRAVLLYHQTNELLLPVRNPGDGLPQEVTDFYHNLLGNLNAKYVEKLKEKPVKSYENFSMTAVLSNNLRESDIFDKKRLKIKRISSTARLRSRIFGNSTGSVAHGTQEGLLLLRDKTAEEIEDMLYGIYYVRNQKIADAVSYFLIFRIYKIYRAFGHST